VAGGGWFLLDRAADGMCGNEIKQTLESPDGGFRAYLFYRDCGATTHTSTQISVLVGLKPLPNDAGNVFRAEPARGDYHDPVLGIRWISPATLEIRYARTAKVFARETKLKEMRITYLTE
jgi:hypothetical protein